MHSEIIEKARDLGFIGIGFSVPHKPLSFDKYTSWISERKNADMSWLERNIQIRKDPSILLPGCKSILSLAYPYSPHKPATPDGLSASRYSSPDLADYHQRVKSLCKNIAGFIKKVHKEAMIRICVDSAPILERSLGYSSGMGFIGKNTMLIIPGFGSYFYLAEILTTAAFDMPAAEPLGDLCDSCSLCVDSCPTGALEKPFYLDASKCLSYLTIEFRSSVNKADGMKMGDCFFGCDRCQEVCPFNGTGKKRRVCLPPAEEWMGMDKNGFAERFGKTALARAGLEKIKTNISAMLSRP